VEREVLCTGIGGQGVQLAARTLALAAMGEGRQVMVFGSYGGMMRGGNTDATVVVGDGPLRAPPTVARSWSALAMHPEYWPSVRDRLRPGGVAVVDAGTFGTEVEVPGCQVLAVDASAVAAAQGAPRAAAMVALGAFAAATDLVGLEALCEAAGGVLPDYRRQHVEANRRALAAGHALVPAPLACAWLPAEVGTSR
jgi:Pyruvate/2-oxoacid:ferredoxin oxidoreductase gamma subunit